MPPRQAGGQPLHPIYALFYALFSRVVETGSFAEAAQTLDVVPSALSKTITALERDRGFTLFNRSTRKVAFTRGKEREVK
jgi:DNA-binding transcriptional LysR family regulator